MGPKLRSLQEHNILGDWDKGQTLHSPCIPLPLRFTATRFVLVSTSLIYRSIYNRITITSHTSRLNTSQLILTEKVQTQYKPKVIGADTGAYPCDTGAYPCGNEEPRVNTAAVSTSAMQSDNMLQEHGSGAWFTTRGVRSLQKQ